MPILRLSAVALSASTLSLAGCQPKPVEQAAPAPASAPQAAPADAGKPAPDMQKVLDKLASLGGKPIEMLTPTEARQQPTPADAVKAVMNDMGQGTAPDPSVTVRM